MIEKKKKRKIEIDIPLPFFGRVSLKDKISFTRNLKVMISSGVSLSKALKTLSSQTKNKKLKSALLEMTEEILKGKNFSDSLSKHPNIFSELFYSIVKMGEESDSLEESLATLSRQMEREDELRSKIKGALMYPTIVIFAMIGIGTMMLIVVVPSFAKTFNDLQVELPLTTRTVIGFGTFLTEKWYFAIAIFIGIGFLIQAIVKKKTGKATIDALILKLPFISLLVKKTNVAYTVRALSSLVSAGVPLARALEIVSNTLGNFHYKQAIIGVLEKVKRGEKLSNALRTYQNLYPLSVVQMIKLGEESGETSIVLAKLGDLFEEEIANTTTNLALAIEPILMLIIGGVVGFFAVSIIQPMYSILNAVK